FYTILSFFEKAHNAALSGEQRTTTPNKTTLNTVLKFATKTAQRCESVFNALLIKCFPQARHSNKPPNLPHRISLVFTGCRSTLRFRNQATANTTPTVTKDEPPTEVRKS
ncbi:hypothetical protein, partial [Vibrio parahaemolyticus]|uniref:hypothetical protein n=1 Tax=Vibrio parahaemolyticus TaxID=670 RepID=UPI001E354C06